MGDDISQVTVRVGPSTIRLEGPAGSQVHEKIRSDLVWERHVTIFLGAVFTQSKSAVLFDVGAHTGYYTVMAAQHGARVVAFEPNPEVRAFLERNVAINGCTGVTVDPRIVGDGRTRMRLVAKTGAEEISYAAEAGEEDAAPAVSLDEYCAATNVWPTIVKCDAEGRDLDVVQGALTVLERRAPPVLIEFQPAKIAVLSATKPDGLFRSLARIGYAPYLFRGHTGVAVELVDYEILQRIYDLNVRINSGGYWDVLLWPPHMPPLTKPFEMPA